MAANPQRPSQPTWPVSLPIDCYHPYLPLPFISISQSQPEADADAHFTVPQRVEDWVYRGTAGSVCCISQWLSWWTQMLWVRFEPGSSHTTVSHATTKPLWPAIHEIRRCLLLNLLCGHWSAMLVESCLQQWIVLYLKSDRDNVQIFSYCYVLLKVFNYRS